MSRLRFILLTLALLLIGAAPAAAACPDEPTTQAFAEWGDPAQYVAVPGGSFDAPDPAWTLRGARVEDGALSLPGGTEATSAATCVALERPTLRFMVRSTGSPLGLLVVTAIVRDGDGLLETLPAGVVTGLSSAWRPSLPMLLPHGLLAALGEGTADVRFRFSATGLGGAFEVDDVYVDPYLKG